MAKKMLIDATHAEETRVVVVEGNKVEEFDFESENRRQLAGNIYLAKVTRIEPSLQAAFIDYGGNRHGFLAFSEIHPDYYQIPVADREALMEEERAFSEAMRRKDEEDVDDESLNNDLFNPETKKEDPENLQSLETDVFEADKKNSSVSQGKSNSKVKTKKSSSKKRAVLKKKASEENSETEEVASTEKEIEKKPRGRPKKSSKPISAIIETDQNDEVINSDDEIFIEQDKSEKEASESSEPGVKKRRYSKRSRKNSNDNTSKVSLSSGEKVDLEIKNQKSEFEDDPQKEIEAVSEIDDEQDIRRIRKPRQRRYKIQEVIKVRQIMLVQVVKEERGNKGAALTTYLSLAGRYCVLMPNTARGGGISRKITNLSDRKKLKEIANEIDVPLGAGLIVRTAGAKRTKSEIKRDYEYLQRLWEQIRELTLKSIAPSKIYEEGDLIKRSIRDLYNRDIDEVLVEGERGYQNAKEFMKMIMPSHSKNVKYYHNGLPLFARYQVESFLSAMFNPVVQLKSGGYIVIGVTEALVAIDVNSGRATKEGSIEDTALKTNLEASDEISRQLRLRDLAGLIVIDFIDMDERKNNANVEKRIKDKLKSDRARIQVGRISGFGLLEMSRQRLRPGMLEATTQSCPSCHGTGLIRSDDNLALSILRQIEEEGVRKRSEEVLVKCPVGIANFIMNQKREYVASIEKNYGLSVRVEGDINLVTPEYSIEKLKSATRILSENGSALVTADGLLELSEDDVIEDLKNEEEKPKKRRRRRRKKKQFDDGEGVNSGSVDKEENTLSENSFAKTSPSNENSSSEHGVIEKRKNQSKRRKKDDNQAALSRTLTEEVSENENSKLKQQNAVDEGNSDVETKEKKEERKKPSKKRMQKKIIENTDTNDKEGYEENSKQKRKGWWSLNG
ncbi:Rne/Rng family ribonuclease [Paracoccaceae bacterium]|nr:Rne/Rng family ribonuclease [Paracoccaceae bacterium]